MAANREIIEYVRQVREATYGKNVREAIAKSLELCYGYTSGETAIEAAERANAAAETVEAVIGESEETLAELQRAVDNIDDIVKVSDTEPSESTNKLWIQPQDGTEYKVATYAAYEALWNQMKGMSETYEQGHGGVVNFEEDTEYVDPDDDELKRRFVITYSDGTTGEIFIHDGERGEIGPVAEIQGVTIFYKKQTSAEFDGRPPEDWESRIPANLGAGDYLWTMAKVTYKTEANVEPKPQAYLYGLSRMGIDGSGAVNSVAIGANGTALVGDVKLPVDSEPTENSGNLLTSGAIYAALQDAGSLDSPDFTGTPTAPTPDATDNSTRIATTAFVQSAIEESNNSAHVTYSVSLRTNETSISYSNPLFTENTVVVAVLGLDYSKLTADIAWTTSDGSLVLSTASAPKEDITFDLVLAKTVQGGE